jgi:hypothetical protein
MELETLGLRLERAHAALSQCKNNTWAHNYWTTVVKQLLTQWQRLPMLQDVDARIDALPKWTVDYSWLDADTAPKYGTPVQMFNPDLDLHHSWQRHRRERLARGI